MNEYFHSGKYAKMLTFSISFHDVLPFCVLQVKAYPCVAAHMLHDLEGVMKTSLTERALILIDVAGYAVDFFVCTSSVIQPLGRTHP